jgi:hypothetical protein
MVALADTALDLGVLELELLLVLVALVFCRGLPVRCGAEDDVLSDGYRVGLGPGGLALLCAEFGPCLALGDARVYDLLDDRLLDAACGLDLLAILVDAVRYDRLGSVLVLGDCLLGEGDVVLVFLFGPVGAAAGTLVKARGGEIWQYAPCYARHGCCVMCGVCLGVSAVVEGRRGRVRAIQRWSGVWGSKCVCDIIFSASAAVPFNTTVHTQRCERRDSSNAP